MNPTLSGVSETLLIPLWARAVETLRPDGIIKDTEAVRMMQQIDYPYHRFEKAWMSQIGIAVRTELLDQAAATFIAACPEATVINLGCGLDTRFFRVDNGRIHWFDLDLPETIALRRQFFTDTGRYRMLGQSIFDFSWIKEVQASQGEVLIIAEGLLMYFNETEVRMLFRQLADSFPRAHLLVEILSPLLVGRSRHHDAAGDMEVSFQWGAVSGKELEELDSRIRFRQEWNYYDFHRNRWRWLRWPSAIPLFKKWFNNKIVRITFEPAG